MVHFKVILAVISSILALDEGYSYNSFVNGNGAKYGFNVVHDAGYKVTPEPTDCSKGFDEYIKNAKVSKNAAPGGFVGIAFSRILSYTPHQVNLDRSYKFRNIVIPSALEYGHIGYPPSKNSIFHSPHSDSGYGSPAYGNSHMSGLGYYGNTKYKKEHQWEK